ncbi:hypothetical protein OAH73_02755 [Planktomarina sp.]|nr:hypothetical protein [Planktomarina sp.]MDB4841486.1 hypothetical protein [Planktomarina sp.]
MNFIIQNQIFEFNKDQSPIKILALHGGGGTSASLSSQAGIVSLMDNLPEVEFVFANAPSNNLWIQDPPGGKGDPTTDPNWADDSIAYLDNFVSQEGPFFGILGYSQGAAFIPVYLANTSNTFNVAVMNNGYLPTTHQGLMSTINSVAPFEITSLIFSGENDYGFKDLAKGLADSFNNSLNVRSSVAGHHLPFESDPAFQELLDFIKENSFLAGVADTFKVIANAGKYFVDGVQAPELELISGKEYSFDLSDSSLSSHPLAFKIDGQSWDEAVTVTGTRGVDQIIKITIPSASQGVISYYCTNHSGMGNDAKIIANKIFGTDDGSTLDGLSGDDVIEAGAGDDILDGGAGDDLLDGGDGDDIIFGGAGDDTITGGAGDDTLNGGAGDDTISLESIDTFGADLYAYNTTSSLQTGTKESINLDGKTRFGDVMDGGANVDTVELTDGSDAFFLHDSFSGFHTSLNLTADDNGKSGTARIANIENIKSGLGDDIVDLTSPDYSLAGQNITVDGGSGNDTLWGSDANETLKGGEGDDALFGGAGTNVLTGGAGADEFQFTGSSTNDTVKDFSLSDGDTLKFFNTGGAQFDRGSVGLNGNVLSISDGAEVLTITLEGANLQMADLGSDVLIIG